MEQQQGNEQFGPGRTISLTFIHVISLFPCFPLQMSRGQEYVVVDGNSIEDENVCLSCTKVSKNGP